MKQPGNKISALSPQKRKLLELMLKEKGLKSGSRAETSTIPKRDRSQPAPLGLNQEGLWFLDQMNPGEANYSIPGTVRLRGRLDTGALENALGEIIRRHEALRTTFAMEDDGTPRQEIAPPFPLKLPVIDLSALEREQREAEARRLATEAAQKPFDLLAGPLVHLQLVKVDATEHVLSINLHHIVADGWSMGVFTRELSTLYEAFRAGNPSPLPALKVQYADFAVWERERMEGELYERRLAYWKDLLSGKLPVLELPTDRPRPPVQSFRGAHLPVAIALAQTESLKAFSRSEGVTLFMTLLAAFKVMLHYYTKQLDLIVATGIANRERQELEDLIGYFATVLPLRTKLTRGMSFRELLERVREVTLGANAHQGIPLARLVQELQPPRDQSRNPLFQAEFTLLTPDRNPAVYGYGLSSVAETITLPELTMEPFDVEGGISRFDLAVFIWDLPQGLTGTVEYSTDLFEATTVKRMAGDLIWILSEVTRQPDSRLSTLVEGLDDKHGHEQRLQKESTKQNIRTSLKGIKRRSAGTARPVTSEN